MRVGESKADEQTAKSSWGAIVAWFKKNQKKWIPIVGVVLVLSLIVGLILIPTSNDEEQAQPIETSELEAGKSSKLPATPKPNVDTDGDGLLDIWETDGWRTADGAVHITDPKEADSDADGLSDGEEAGPLVSEEGQEPVFTGVADPNKTDTDDDRLDDKAELRGWENKQGLRYVTDPLNADTDGDGLPDGAEAGLLLKRAGELIVYLGFSDPLKEDTDGDGLSDLEEADSGTDPYASDTDGDGLDDYLELVKASTDPNSIDTDGDGLDDKYEIGNRESQGLDPLHADIQVSTWDYAKDFATGAIMGDFKEIDSIAWLIGAMSVGLLGIIPVFGQVLGSITELRDVVANLINRDWVSAGFNATALIPIAGGTALIIGKVSKFIKKNPGLGRQVGTIIANYKALPDKAKIEILKATDSSWGALIRKGTNDLELLKLKRAGVDLKLINDAMARPGHKKGNPVAPFQDWRKAESHLRDGLARKSRDISEQTYFSTVGCVKVCRPNGRKFDVVADGVAHESKVGYVSLTEGIEAQIRADAHFMKTGQIQQAHWNFYKSDISGTLGPSKPVLDLLDELKITYTIYLPKG